MILPDEDYQVLPSEKHTDIPKWTRDLLDELRPEEVEALRRVARLGPEGTAQLLAAIELARSVGTVAKFVKWLVIGCLGIFFASMLFAEKIITLLSWISKGKGQ
ncbi:hypothetical protein SAMN02745157_1483 [Kaistia soli DSM 19436]|uniref:Uncharacterized protein n=1 Tax=Kaistia soli DSM 19436 TaxID=1122133 RepID=A0A1M4YCT5_9HYPH|nr:hypothetical protein [Kaistia soli]SHF03428.1 hypothetical protein SAMN02745157_1483 [Kaistia soli DSM 19436]